MPVGLKGNLLLVVLVLFSIRTMSQSSDASRAEIDSLIIHQLEKLIIDFDHNYISQSKWMYRDGTGSCTLLFSSKHFKLDFDGARNRYDKVIGSWNIFDKYLVLETRKGKYPLYVIDKNGAPVILDDQHVAIMTGLIGAIVYNQQWAGYLTKSDIIGFVDGFELVENQ